MYTYIILVSRKQQKIAGETELNTEQNDFFS